MSLNDISEHELRATAVHEAGHLVAIRALGGAGHARVWANHLRRADVKAWCGRMQTLVAPNVGGWEVIVGLAGLVAELVDRSENDAEAIARQIQSRGDLDEIAVMDPVVMTAQVQRTLDLLLPRWSEVLWETDWMERNCESAA